MRVLITNDDGVHAEGIAVLADCAREVFGADVTTVAPLREMSGVGQSLSLRAPVRLQPIGERVWAVDGTPVDSVFVALGHVMAETRPELVLSGINHGPNVSYDVYYSGTVGAAREALIHGIPSVAFSLMGHPPFAFDAVRPIVRALLEQVKAQGIPEGNLLNVNIPDPAAGEPDARFCGVPGIAGARVTRLGKRTYGNEVVRRDDPRGREYLWIGGAWPRMDLIAGTDCEAVRQHCVSVTPMGLDVTAAASIPGLQPLADALDHD